MGAVSHLILNILLLIFKICQIILVDWPDRWSINTFLHFVWHYILAKSKRECFVSGVLFCNQELQKSAFVFTAQR